MTDNKLPDKPIPKMLVRWQGKYSVKNCIHRKVTAQRCALDFCGSGKMSFCRVCNRCRAIESLTCPICNDEIAPDRPCKCGEFVFEYTKEYPVVRIRKPDEVETI